MRIIFLIPFLVGCANVAATRFEYTDNVGGKLTVEMPKEVDAKDLKISIDPKNSIISITATSWTSRNVETIAAQGERETGIAEGISEGAVKGAIKGIKGL